MIAVIEKCVDRAPAGSPSPLTMGSERLAHDPGEPNLWTP